MARMMTTGRQAPQPQPGILGVLSERESKMAVRKAIRRLRREQAQSRRDERRYDGGLPMEVQSLDTLRTARRAAAKTARRVAVLSRIGRRIDLVALLGQRRPDGSPRWTVADPIRPTQQGHYAEGTRDADGTLKLGGEWVSLGAKLAATYAPSGIPALPPRVRDLATDPKIRRRAKWVGVLYEPAEWHRVNPDPALVVEWRDQPGVYYALAVWGVDGPRIMEFVD